MKILQRYILLSFIIFSSLMAEAVNTFQNPDFAFPQTVQANAEVELKKAVASDDAPTAITALLQIATAKSNIDRASLADVIALSDSTAAKFGNSDFAPIFHLLTARLYDKYYSNNRWTYDRRELPLEPSPADISEWSGDQFKAVIADFCAKATEGASKTLRNVPLSKGDQFLTYDKLSAEFYPSLFDFVLEASTNLVASSQSNKEALVFFRRYATNPDGRPTEALWAYRMALLSPDTETELQKNINLDNPYSSLSLKAYAERMSLSSTVSYIDIDDDFLVEEEIAENSEPTKDPVKKAANAVKLMRDFLDKNPNAVFSEAIEQQIKRLCAASIRVKAPNLTAPLTEIKLNVVNTNAKHYFINIFKLPSHIQQGRALQTYLGNSTPIRRIEIRTNIGVTAPFQQDTTLTASMPEPGRYVIVPSVPGQKKYDDWYSIVRCVPVLPLTISNVERPAVIVSHPVTGEPIKGAAVSTFSHRTSSKPVATDAFGVAFPSIVNGGASLRIKYNGASYDFETLRIYKFQATKPDDEPDYGIAVMTDRAIYHPGDSLQFLAVAHATQNKKQWLASGKKMMFILDDANYESIDTLECTGDEFGRGTGAFKLPKDGLTGQFRITAHIDDDQVGHTYFTVADYRMPEFELRDLVVANDTPAKGDVTVRGEAYTYSGMPVADCDVELVLSTASRWRWFSPQEKVFAVKTTTDNAGRFSAVIPDSIFKERPNVPYYIANISASAPNGSTAEASTPVVKGKPYVIQVAVANAESVNGEKPLAPKVEVFDPDGKAVTTTLLYSIKNDLTDKIVMSGEFTADSINISSLTPGEYVLTIKPVNEEIANSVSTSFTVYNRSTGICPEGKKLFIIKGNTDIPADGRVSISFAVPSESYIHYSVASETKLDSLAMIKVGAGYHDLDITIPNGIDCANVTLFMVKDLQTAYETITFTRKFDNTLTIEGSSFRDRLLPGQPETWNFSIRPENGDKGLQAALALDMYNKALDAIVPHSFNLSFPTTFEYPSAYLRRIFTSFATNTYSSSLRFKNLPELEMPQLRYINQSYYTSGIRMKMRAMSAANDLKAVKEESVEFDMAAADQLYGSAAGIAMDDSALMEVVVTTESKPTGEDAQKPEIDYRASEVPMALWAPMLTTDTNGNVSVSFTVPNANTTWVLRGLAWSADMKVGTMLREFVASKPVMVQPNLPRFLRAGDEAEIVASVMNNGDESADITCTVEIFDPVTNAIIDTRTEKLTLDAKASQTVAMKVSAPSDAAAIGYRVNAVTGNFSDGEQNVIQILPDEAQLIETTPFYLNPGDTSFSMRLPKEKDTRISLTFCENPAWTIVSALPGLRSLDEESANSAAAAIFSAAVARGIIKDNPSIGAAIREWLDNPQDSTLVSMLERNQDLKIALLNATPWISAARSDSERMAQLALIFDDKQTNAAIRQGIRTLQKLQCSDGGWAWGSWMKESSKWVTMNILEGMANLIDMGYFPDDNTLVDMVKRAVAYIDGEAAKANSEYKDYTDMYYAAIRPLYVGGKLDIPVSRMGAKAVIDRTLNNITANWRSYTSPSYKAIAATALYRNGRKATARLLTSSIAEFGVRSASQGVSFPSVNDLSSYTCILEAFALIDPQSPMVDGIRQYLIVRKEATDWGSAVVTTDVVASILSTGSCWTVPAEGSTVTVDGTEIEATTPMERATGALEADLSDFRGKKLVITSSGTGPSYGAVYAQFSRKMTDVKARAIDDLSIEKVLFVRQGSEWVEASDAIPVGSRVKVQLTIHTKRNLDYVTIIDDRPAAFSPVDQIPGWMWSEGCGFYRENRNSFTALYVSSMRPGTYLLTYEMNVTLAGTFSSGVATIQSQYAPAQTAHSSAAIFKSAAK